MRIAADAHGVRGAARVAFAPVRTVRVDDEIADAERTWVATHDNAAVFLRRVAPGPP
ncbi:hypothetical protein AB0B83_01885 [Micromonospora sp. NPDC049060]|uniref:hypothetical protein n=1 Tax=unclassified Micromonospora TaxID=2617518 RepID=UPI0033ED6F3C